MEHNPIKPKPDLQKKETSGEASNHRTRERREKPSDGYTCIPMVGWICRREKTRRKKDKLE